MQSLLAILLQHIDTIIQSVATLLAALIPGLGNKPLRTKKGRRQRKADQIRYWKSKQHLKRYVHMVLHDPHITQIQIVGMNHPLKLEEVYVPLNVHPESNLRYTLDPALREAEDTHDPNLLEQAAQQSLEHFIDGAIDPVDAIQKYKHCVIVGDPGAGKTTLLRYLAIKSAKNELVDLPSFPVYVQLNTFNIETHRDLASLIMAQLNIHISQSEIQDVQELFEEKMQSGQVLLLLDGLDETRIGTNNEDANRSYTSLVDDIAKLAKQFPHIHIVVTIRKAGYEFKPKLQGFDELEVVDFRLKDSKTFVANWFNASDSTSKAEKIKDLSARLERNLRMQMLATNPLILSLIAILYEKQLELPERRADFYTQFVEVLQRRWDTSRDIQRQQLFPQMSQPQLLQEVAWHFHNQGKRYFPIDELLQVIGKFLPTVDIPASQSEQVLEQIAIDNGLLRKQAHGWYGFSHLTFQEYFVTQYIIHNNRKEALLEHLNNPWWEEVLLLYVGSVSDASFLLQILMGHDDPGSTQADIFHTYLILAGRCLAEKPRVQNIQLREKVINRLFEVLHTTPYALTRERIANTLAMIGGARVNRRLLDLLSSNAEQLLDIRESIGWAIGASGERNLARELALQLSHKQTGRYIRIIIARTLGMLADASVTESLLNLLRKEQEDIYVRQSVALTLGTLGDQGVVTGLIDLLEDKDENPLVRQSIVVALGILGDQRAAPRLLDLLNDDQLDWNVRGSAAKALGMLGAQAALPPMLQILADNYDNTYVRGRIAVASGSFAPTDVPLERLLTLLSDEMLDSGVRSRIARTLGTLGRQEVISTLLQLLADRQTEHNVRASIATALGYLGNQDMQVIDVLQEIRSDKKIDANLRGSSIAALGMLGTRTIIYELLELIKDPQLNQDLLLHVVQALANIGGHDSVEKQEIACKLVEILAWQHVDRYKSQNIVKLLCDLGEDIVVPSLLDLLADPTIERDIRQHVCEGIARIARDEQSFTRLRSLLETTDIPDSVFRALWAVNRQLESKIKVMMG